MSDYGAVELREAAGGKLVLRGYASVSERWYPVGGMFEERVIRGTWARGLAEGPDTVLLQDHSGLGLARTKTPSGDPSLLLSETDRGLFTEAFLDASAPRVQDLRSTAENCGLQMSVAFRCSQDKWNEDRSRRELKEASVHKGDVTVCNFGANDAAAATISARGEAAAKERRAYAESLKGGTERRMCPVDGYELRETATLTVAQTPPIRSYVAIARNHAAGGHAEEPRGRSQIRVPRYLEIAKARRAAGRYSAVRAGAGLRALPGSDSGVEGEEDQPRYTQADIDALGEKGLALKRKNGPGYHYPIKDRRDLLNALKAWGRVRPTERAGVRTWIKIRARLMRLENELPKSWQAPLPPGHSERPDSGATESGQEQ
jgi:HK97 family phage prohead protease